jgi:hypothetical protein
LGDLPRAYVLLEAYLARVAAPPERVAEVRKEMGEIEARLGWIAVECGPGVDHVVVDYRDLATLGACPFRRRMRVALGNHRVQARAMETFTVNAGATLGLSFVRRPRR